MKLMLDTADLDYIKRLYDYLPLDGITTNPTILANTGRDPFEVLHEIRDFIGPDQELFVQTIATDWEGMVADSARIRAELGPNTYTKIPVTKDGLKATRIIAGEGHNVLGTAIYNTLQAWLAAKAGAKYVAPYMNRIANLEHDEIQTTMDMHDLFRENNMECEVLAASFKNLHQLLALARYGVGAATIAPEVLEPVIGRQYVTDAVDVFTQNFAKLVGEGKTLADL